MFEEDALTPIFRKLADWIKDEILNIDELAMELLRYLIQTYPKLLIHCNQER